MKKFFSFLLIFLALTGSVAAQVNIYGFSQSVLTYTPITGGTMLINGTSAMDSWVSTAQTIPSFTFNGVAYTTAFVTSNGQISLGGTAPSTTTYTGISTGVGSGINLCPFSADLNRATTTTATEIRWEQVGNEIVFQWQGICRYNQTENFDMQVRMNTVTGVILFVYKLNSGPGSGTTYQPQVGIRTSATDYLNRLVGTGTEDWPTSLVGSANTNNCRFTSAAPAKSFVTGLTYTFTPPAPGTPLPPTTPAPANAALSVPVNGTLSWTFGANTVTYDLWFGPAGSMTQVVTGGSAGATGSYTYSGLSNSTVYQWQVIERNGALTTTGPVWSFTTLCGIISTFPWNENFDAMTAVGNSIFPVCWTATSGSGTPWYTGNAASNTYNDPCSPPNYAYVYYSPSSTDKYLFTPGFALTGGTSYDFSFNWVGDNYAGWTGDVMVNTSQSGTGATALTPAFLASGTTSPTTCSLAKRSYIPSATGTYYFIIHVYNTSAPYYLGFDNFRLELTPTCLEPTALAISSILTTSASISWTASITPPANGYDIFFSTSTTPPSAGTLPSGSVAAGVTSYVMGGLTPATVYYAWVRSVCSGSDKSTWAGPVSFTTACNAITTFPLTESFDGTLFAPVCWTNLKTAGTGTPGIWDRQTAGTYPTCTPHSGAAMTRYNSFSLASGTKGILVTPQMTIPTDQYMVKFWMFRDDGYPARADLVNVYYNTAPNTTGATLLGTINRYYLSTPIEATANQWYQYTFNVPPGSFGDAYIVFEAESIFGNNMYLDDIVVTGPPCDPPTALTATNITMTAADLGWTSTATSWEYQFGATGYTPSATGTFTAVHPVHITGLTANTPFDFYVRSNCSGMMSPWAGPFTFTTLALPPVVVTTAATLVTATGATLTGTANGNAATTAVSFEYGLTTAYGSTVTGTPPTVNTSSAVPVTGAITGLLPNSLYHYRIKGVNSGGTANGNDMTFTTATAPPIVVTVAANAINTTGGTLNGTVTANNSSTTVSFEYGLTTAYGNTAPAVPATVTGSASTPVSAVLTGLLANTTYHFRCVGTNVAGTTYGSDLSFMTNCPPTGPAGQVFGSPSVCAGSVGNIYTVDPIVNATGYAWTLPAGASITNGANTNTITVTFGTTSGSVVVAGVGVCGNGAPSSVPVTVHPLPVPTIAGTATACQSAPMTYTTQTGMSGYVWTVSAGGTITSGAGTNAITVTWNTTGAQSVTVNYADAFGCMATVPASFAVNVLAAPAPSISGPAGMCVNSGYYDYTTQTGMTNYVWTISSGGTITWGQGTAQAQVVWTSPGPQWVAVNYSNSNGCSASAAIQYAVTVNPLPGAAGTITGLTEFCGGTTGVAYSMPSVTNATSYVWMLPPGATIATGAGTNSITVDFATSASPGNITAYGNNVCGNGLPSAPLMVNVTPIPATPVITLTGYTLTSNVAYGNQWYMDGTLLTAATSQSYTATETGTYWTVVTVNGCASDTSNNIYVLITGTGNLNAKGITIYPVPNDGLFRIGFPKGALSTYSVEVMNELGKVIFNRTGFRAPDQGEMVVDIRPSPNGVYFVRISSEAGIVTRKIVLNH